MPYATIEDLPPAVRHLPLHAREIFLGAFNGAWQSYADRGPQARRSPPSASAGQRSNGATESGAMPGLRKPPDSYPLIEYARSCNILRLRPVLPASSIVRQQMKPE